ncbi:sensor histidine kinase [Rhodoferax bucti]|uniref:sensor histidine kinase n=1 Tax=Rhodoferax bucti TaxID=2576305 RepID=UPI001108DF82|nr:sensor histidine kinase [Rhodoferax bucti]
MSRPARFSLKRQLLIWLLLPQLVLWLMGGVLAFRVALAYAEKTIDQSLTQSVRSLARQVKPMGSGLLVDFPRAARDIIEQDPTDRVAYMVSSPPGSFLLGNTKIPGQTPDLYSPANEPVLYEVVMDGKPMRVASIDLSFGDGFTDQRMRVQVAKSLVAQQRIARELVRDVLFPLLILGAVLSVLVYEGIRRGLAPLERLEAQLANRNMASLSPIEMTQAPEEVHSLANTLNQLLTTLRRSLSQEKRFLNDAAHQLRTPLAGLISQTELAMHEKDPDALQQRLAKVHTGAQRSAHLVHQLLSLARTEAEVSLVPVDAASLAREVAREWTRRALAAGVDLGYEGEDSVMVPADKLLLREVLSNLIDNALRYAGKGAVVTLRTTIHEGHCWLDVEDTGPGLSTEHLERVFERFWRASELPGGCGLGLSIVAEIARRHNGTATAQTTLPHGLTIRLELPLQG